MSKKEQLVSVLLNALDYRHLPKDFQIIGANFTNLAYTICKVLPDKSERNEAL